MAIASSGASVDLCEAYGNPEVPVKVVFMGRKYGQLSGFPSGQCKQHWGLPGSRVLMIARGGAYGLPVSPPPSGVVNLLRL